MLGLSTNLRYFVCCQTVDMRNGFDGLAGIVRNQLGKDPISGDVFIFLNRTRTHIKLLHWDGDGFAVFYKRLERGRYTLMTSGTSISRQIKREDLYMLLEGLSSENMRRSKRYKRV